MRGVVVGEAVKKYCHIVNMQLTIVLRFGEENLMEAIAERVWEGKEIALQKRNFFTKFGR
jgi:broad-specificity NMP kinase